MDSEAFGRIIFEFFLSDNQKTSHDDKNPSHDDMKISPDVAFKFSREFVRNVGRYFGSAFFRERNVGFSRFFR